MMDFILSREVMITTAIIGAALSVLASVLQSRRGKDMMVQGLIWSGYGFMGISMGIFIFVGLVGRW